MQHEGNDPAIDIAGRDLGRRDAAQEEQRPAERRGEKRGLQVHADQRREPHHVDIGRHEHRQEQRHGDVGNLDPFDEEAEDEDDQHQEPDVGVDAARQEREEIVHDLLTLQPRNASANTCAHIRMNIIIAVVFTVA